MKLLAFLFLAGIASAALALDATRYYPLKAGNQWSYKNTGTGATNTTTVGNPVKLSTGVLAFPVTSVQSDISGQSVSYETSDQNGVRYHQNLITGSNFVVTGNFSPPGSFLPAQVTVGSTRTFSYTNSQSFNSSGTVT